MICMIWSTMGGAGAVCVLQCMQSAPPCSHDPSYALNVHSAHLRIALGLCMNGLVGVMNGVATRTISADPFE